MLTTQQFAEWSEFYELEPWGFVVEDARFGGLNHTIAASAGNKDLTPKDFMMDPPPPPTPEELKEREHDEMVKRLHQVLRAPPASPGPESTAKEML